MLYLAPIFLLVISYLLGELFTSVIRDNQIGIAERCLVGTFIFFTVFEAFNLVTIKLEGSFKIMSIAFTIFLLAIILVCGVFIAKKIYEHLEVKNPINIKPILIIACVIFVQVICFFILMPDTEGDCTVSTVNTTLMSDRIYENHPEMGDTFEYGITFRGKLVALPIMYSYIKTLFSGSTVCLVYRAIPIWTLLLSFICYGIWAKYLFKKDENVDIKVVLFLMGLGLLNMCGIFSKNCIFYNQMFRGFRGETIVFAVIAPYCLYCLLYMVNTKTNKKWIYIFLSLLAEITIADFQKGFIPTIISLLVFILLHHVARLWRWIKCRQ